MLETLRIQNYGCIVDATLELSPLHALIGPNDSGKSTVLRAIDTLAAWGAGFPLDSSRQRAELMRESAKRGPVHFSLRVGQDAIAIAAKNGGQVSVDAIVPGATRALTAFWTGEVPQLQRVTPPPIADAIRGARMLRLEPDELRKPGNLIPEGHAIRLDEKGTGLPGAYDAILSRDLAAFSKIRDDVTKLFPTVKNVRLVNVSETHKAMRVELVDGTLVTAEYMSEGLLYYLAFAALPHLEPTAILLVEEPENGLHPARIREVMRVLRELSKTMQVILATHSPIVVNELEGHEVSVLTRRTQEEGTRVKLLKDTPSFAERSKVYSLGELWVSYADGDDERALLEGGSRP